MKCCKDYSNKTNDKQKHSEYSNPIIEFYEVEGQMDIFDFLDTEQKNRTGSEEHLKYKSEENHEQ